MVVASTTTSLTAKAQKGRGLCRGQRWSLERVAGSIDDSEAGLYLWATRGEPWLNSGRWFAELGNPRRARRVLRSAVRSTSGWP